MTASDKQSQHPTAAGATIALFKALFPCINPFSEDDNEKFLRGLHHGTGGSDNGFALADELLSQGEDYQGTEELASKWRSYNDSTEDPVTLDDIREMLESYGFDWVEICSSVEPDPESHIIDIAHPDEPSQLEPSTSAISFDRHSLKGTGADISSIISNHGEDFERCESETIVVHRDSELTSEAASDKQIGRPIVLTQFSLSGSSAELEAEALAQVYVLASIALLGGCPRTHL